MPFDNAAAPVNGGSLAFGFSRPRYAAFRIKPGFTRVLRYIGAPVSPSRLSMLRYDNAYPIDSLEHRLTAVVVDVEVDNMKEREKSDSRQEERKRHDRVILDIGRIYIPVCPLIRHGSEPVKVS